MNACRLFIVLNIAPIVNMMAPADVESAFGFIKSFPLDSSTNTTIILSGKKQFVDQSIRETFLKQFKSLSVVVSNKLTPFYEKAAEPLLLPCFNVLIDYCAEDPQNADLKSLEDAFLFIHEQLKQNEDVHPSLLELITAPIYELKNRKIGEWNNTLAHSNSTLPVALKLVDCLSRSMDNEQCLRVVLPIVEDAITPYLGQHAAPVLLTLVLWIQW